MKLFYSPGACSLSVHIALKKSGLASESIAVPTPTHQLADGPDDYTINPLGNVPLLVIDGERQLRECVAIRQCVARQVPAKARRTGRLEWTDGEPGSKSFLMGNTFTVADAYLYVVQGWRKHVGVVISALSSLKTFAVSVCARPAVQAARRAEGLRKQAG